VFGVLNYLKLYIFNMKKVYLFTFVFILAFSFEVKQVFADIITAPVVSIGIGNGNSPENTSPVHGVSYNGDVAVYATITDDDLDNYHFRVVKDGGIDGYTCTELGALFAIENQGYASTTLSKSACGFVFNQSVYVASTGFANSLIATLNTEDIIAFGGEGDYWLILGAVDTAGNRTNSNYLNDSRVKITVSNTVPVVVAPPVPVVVSGGGGGNGPIVNSYGISPSGFTPASVSNPEIFSNPETSSENSNDSSMTNTHEKTILADGGIPESNFLNTETNIISTTSIQSEDNSSNQAAQVVSTGFSFNWPWLLFLILGLGGFGYYFYFKKD